MRSTLRGLRVLLGVFTLVATATGDVLPTFHLRPNLRAADHILVVTEGRKIDGNLTVLEVWRGPMKPQARFRLARAAGFSHKRFKLPDGGILSCRRMVLFLKGPPADMKPALWDRLACSTVWIEDGKSFTWDQRSNPGRCQVWFDRFLKNEAALLAKVRDYDRKTVLFARAMKIPDSLGRARALEPLLASWWVDDGAFAKIRDCGLDAAPVLWAILDNPERWRWHSDAVKGLASIAGEAAAPRLARIAAADLPYWERVAPVLKRGWSRGHDPARSSRYSRLASILRVLGDMGRPDARATAVHLRRLCKRYPLFAGEEGTERIVVAVDRYLATVDRPPK